MARRQLSSTYLDFREKRILFIHVLQVTNKANVNLRNLFVSVTIFCVWTNFDFIPPRQTSRNMWHESCTHTGKMTTRGNIHSFIYFDCTLQDIVRRDLILVVDGNDCPSTCIKSIFWTSASLDKTQWRESTIKIEHRNKRLSNGRDDNAVYQHVLYCWFETDISLFDNLFVSLAF